MKEPGGGGVGLNHRKVGGLDARIFILSQSASNLSHDQRPRLVNGSFLTRCSVKSKYGRHCQPSGAKVSSAGLRSLIQPPWKSTGDLSSDVPSGGPYF